MAFPSAPVSLGKAKADPRSDELGPQARFRRTSLSRPPRIARRLKFSHATSSFRPRPPATPRQNEPRVPDCPWPFHPPRQSPRPLRDPSHPPGLFAPSFRIPGAGPGFETSSAHPAPGRIAFAKRNNQRGSEPTKTKPPSNSLVLAGRPPQVSSRYGTVLQSANTGRRALESGAVGSATSAVGELTSTPLDPPSSRRGPFPRTRLLTWSPTPLKPNEKASGRLLLGWLQIHFSESAGREKVILALSLELTSFPMLK